MDTTVTDPLVGQLLDGRYRVRSRIARGGMATVYVGHDSKLDRTVALKVMHANLAGDEEFIRRFIGEAKSAAALSHPNVVAVYDQGTDRGYVYLAMEYVAGRTLRDGLNMRGRLGPREALQTMQPILAALGAAHRAGLIHRDVKPENVLLTDDGQIKVADFGLARAESASKQTKTGMLIGTVGYIAPEQVLSGASDARTDVYAAGILLFEMLTGRQPHEGDTPLVVAYKHVNEVVPLPSSVIPGVPPQLDALVAAATAHDPARRPSDANHFLSLVSETYRQMPPDIDAVLSSARPLPPPDPTAHLGAPAQPPPGRHTMVVPREDHTEQLSTMATVRPRRTGLIALFTAVGLIAATLVGWFAYSQTIGQQMKVPDLIAMSEHNAVAKATQLGLKVRTGSRVYSSSVGIDGVVSVTPKVGAQVDKGSLITLVVSKGKQPIAIPNVQGQAAALAQTALQQAGLKVAPNPQQQPSATVPIGNVIATNPAAGTKQNPDDPVTLVVSQGIQVPNLMNLNQDQAGQALQKLGLTGQFTQQPPQNGQPPNTVIGQNPPAGSPVNKGAVIQVTITKADTCQWWNPFCNNSGQPTNNLVQVPNVVGQLFPIAQAQLQAAGLNVQAPGGSPTGMVRTQNIPPNSQVARGTTITITP